MTEKGIIYQEEPQQCDFCGKIKELRPYGPNGECICFDCGMKDETTTAKQFLSHVGIEVPKNLPWDEK